MKYLARAAAAGLLAGLILAGVLWRLWTAPGPDLPGGSSAAEVRIPRGATWTAAADSLAARGLLEHPRLLPVMVRLRGDAGNLKAGLYRVPAGTPPRGLADLLVTGRTVPVRVTLPEGWTARRMAAELSAGLGFRSGVFLAVADSVVRSLAADPVWPGAASLARCDSVLRELGDDRFHLAEGYLAPDTYFFAEGTGAREAAALLVRTQLDRLDDALTAAPGSGADLDPHQVLTLASLVETEARLDAERPLIAAVYLNRLRRGWKLEADPTVAFALDRTGTRLFRKDLEVDSPYNTYRRRGLPPGPIACPGTASLRAAARPDSSCRAMVFVSDGGRGHVFSETAAEHARAVARFRAVRDRQRRQAAGAEPRRREPDDRSAR